MSERKSFVLISDRVRGNAQEAIDAAADRCRVVIYPPKRTIPQNDKMWAMLTDVARAKPEGRHWPPETWKAAFMHYLGHQVMFAEGLDDTGPFPLGFRSSRLTVAQMADLITVIHAYGDQHGVEWSDTKRGGFWEDQAA